MKVVQSEDRRHGLRWITIAIIFVFSAIALSGNQNLHKRDGENAKLAVEPLARFLWKKGVPVSNLIPDSIAKPLSQESLSELRGAVASMFNMLGIGGKISYSTNGMWKAVKRVIRKDPDAPEFLTSIIDEKGTPLWQVETEDLVYISNDGKIVITGNPNFDFGIRIYNYPSTKPVAVLPGGPGEVMFSDDGKYVLMNGMLLTSMGKVIATGGFVTMSPDARFLLRGGAPPNSEPQREDIKQREDIQPEPQRIETTGVEEIEDSLGNVVLRNEVRVKTAEPVDIESNVVGEEIKQYTLFSRDGSVVTTGTVVVYNYSTYFSKLRLSKPSGKFFAMATYHNDLFVFESETGKQLWKYQDALVYNGIAALDIFEEKSSNEALVLIGLHGTPNSPRDEQSWIELLNRDGTKLADVTVSSNLQEGGFINAVISNGGNIIVCAVGKGDGDIEFRAFKVRRYP